MTDAAHLKIRIRLMCGDEIAMGPGKADLLEAIEREGSISGAGRSLGMSYRRSWMLVDTMNRCWAEPLVETAAGGSHGGGARVTERGREVLRLYRRLQQRIDGASGVEWAALERGMLPEPRSDRKG